MQSCCSELGQSVTADWHPFADVVCFCRIRGCKSVEDIASSFSWWRSWCRLQQACCIFCYTSSYPSCSYQVCFFKDCKTYFCCILISWFWNVEISLHFNLAFSQCSTSIYQAFDGLTEFSRVFNFAIFSYSRNSWKFDAREKYVFYSIMTSLLFVQRIIIINFCNILTVLIRLVEMLSK